jgi:hypothetical protein
MKCSKCDYDNLPEETYCESCGEPLLDNISDNKITGPNETVPDTSDQVSSEPEAVPEVSDQINTELESLPVFLPVGAVPQVESKEDQNVDDRMNTSAPEVPVKKKTGSSIWITVTVIILAIALIAMLGVVFRYKILKIFSPERYLQVALGRTFSDKNYSKMIDMSKYDNKPVEYEISVETEGVGGEVSVMYDAKAEKALIEALFDDGTNVHDGNLLYISRKLIAISIPDLLTETEFLTIDPETFEDDLEELGVEESFPTDFLDKSLDMFFGKSENETMNKDEAAEYYREAKFLEEYADFSQGKTVTEKINGKNYKLDTMSYEISEEDANQYLQDMFDNYKQGVMDGMESLYQGYDLEGNQDQMEAAFDVFDDIRISGDVVITYYVDSNDYVRKIVVNEFEMTLSGEEGKFAIEFEMLLGGKKNPSDNISSVLALIVDGEKVELVMNWEESLESGVFKGELELFIEGTRNDEDTGMTIEIEWDTKDTKGENFKAEFSIEGQEGVGIEVTGTLVDSKTSTAFTDGELILYDGYSNEIVVEFECSISIIDPKEISIDIDDSMSLLEYAKKLGTDLSEDEYLT